MRVCFEVFRSSFSTWNTLFEKAAAFASEIPPDRLISISHSQESSLGVVTVWYWSE